MHFSRRFIVIQALYSGLVLAAPMLGVAEAYVDPGTTGMVSQLLYLLFYGFLGLFLYGLRYIKQFMTRGKQYLAKLFAPKVGDG